MITDGTGLARCIEQPSYDSTAIQIISTPCIQLCRYIMLQQTLQRCSKTGRTPRNKPLVRDGLTNLECDKSRASDKAGILLPLMQLVLGRRVSLISLHIVSNMV
jgi:hypothetical protein